MDYLSLLLSRPGAVAGGGVDAAVAAHYGQPLKEQRALADGRAVVDLSHLGVVTVSGPDRLSWLDTLSSQRVNGLAAGQSSQLLLLDIQGRIDFDIRLVDDGATAWLIVEPGLAAGLAEFLERMRFMLRVEVADVSAAWAVVAATADVPAFDGLAAWRDPWPEVGAGGFSYAVVETERHPGRERPWTEWLLPQDELDSRTEGLELAGMMAAEALRVAAWRPRQGFETDNRAIPHELDLIRTAVHLAKGCYKGQETIARVHNLGHPPRRLVFLQLDGSQHTLPALDSPVTLDGRTVGRVSSVAQHYEMGPIALALVKRTVDPTAVLTIVDSTGSQDTEGNPVVEEYVAAQEIIVAPDAGQVVGRQSGFLRPPR
ncbi:MULTISPECIES: folate-binding protein [Arthrobacter]|uniref:Folate-binding protein n=2 Tax=Arthrobacter TaxID=1663 RepID=A0ABU9KQM9_9MICC|nr:folate-binding protein [Arthrobacter sp. YJM1]MDP5227912.1 folate-binding protein [Arthrobacter sp. YJM1]